MIRLGLTGSIGMGKSTIAAMFADEGVPVWDADEAVHRLYATSQPLKDALVAEFGDVLTGDGVDRAKLSAALNGRFDALNAIVHPAVTSDRAAFMTSQTADIVLADIPLLYETGAEKALDKVIVVSAPAEVQRARVLARPGMTEARFAAILGRQMPDETKRRRADFVIDTSQSLDTCRGQVLAILDNLRASPN